MHIPIILKKHISAFLYALGISFCMLSGFGMQNSFSIATITIAVIVLFALAFKFSKIYKLIALAVLASLLIFGLVSGSIQSFLFQGLQMFKLLEMFIKGTSLALLVYSQQIAIIIAIVAALVALACSEDYIIALGLLLFFMYLSYQLNPNMQYLYTLPAWLAILLIMMNKSRMLDIKSYIAILLIIAMSFIVLPFTVASLKPLNDVNNNIKQNIRDYLFFTEEREVFSLENYGYYPEGRESFGGPVSLKDEPVMTVKTDKPILLKAISKDLYTGSCFVSTTGTSRYLFINPRWFGLRQKILCENLPDKALSEKSSLLQKYDVDVDMYSNGPTTMLLPAYLRQLKTYGDMVPYFNEAGEVFITRNIKIGDKYQFSAPIIQAGDPGLAVLIESSEDRQTKYYEQIYSTYTQLPSHLEDALFKLKDRVVKPNDSPYQKALSIMNFLKQGYGYKLDVKEIPENLDFVSYFLLVSKEGYCVYFASAMTILARMSGLPARYVEGFLVQPDADGIARVRSKNAHAWCEVYLKGFGWLPFDATAGRIQNDNKQNNVSNKETPPTPSPTPPQNSPEPNDVPQSPEPSDQPMPLSPEPSDPPQNDVVDNNNPNILNNILSIILFIIMLIALCAYFYFAQTEQMVSREDSYKQKLFIYSQAIFIMLNIYGKSLVGYKGNQSLLEYARKLDNKLVLRFRLLPFAIVMNKAMYSNKNMQNFDVKTAKDSYEALYYSLSWFKKLYARLLFAHKAYKVKGEL